MPVLCHMAPQKVPCPVGRDPFHGEKMRCVGCFAALAPALNGSDSADWPVCPDSVAQAEKAGLGIAF